MKESTLKKEFSKSTVQRMRNILTGQSGDKTKTQSGWDKHYSDHVEGDVWEESGKTWTIKNGIKQTITKLDSIKKLVVLPITCPSCAKAMKVNEINKKMYSTHKKCFDCVIKEETQMKISGKWEDYEKQMINKNKNANLSDIEMALEQWYKDRDTIVTEGGDIENWAGGDKKKMYEEIKSYLDKMKNTEV